MPTLPLRWFVVLVCLFLAAFSVDFYFSHAKKTDAALAESERVDVAAFMTAARADTLTNGRIIYRANAAGLADLSATTKSGNTTKTIRTTARITETDLAVLRERHFVEDDAVNVAAIQTITGAERAASIAQGAMQPLG